MADENATGSFAESEHNGFAPAKVEPVVEEKPTAIPDGMFPVRMNREYRPLGVAYKVLGVDGYTNRDEPESAKEGEVVLLPIEEARNVVANGIAHRADPI